MLRVFAGVIILCVVAVGAVWLFSSTSSAEPPVQNAHVTISCVNDANNPTCEKPLHPSGERITQIDGLTGLEAADLCADGYNEWWSDNQGHKSPSCYGFDDTLAGGLASPYFVAPKKAGKWIINWQMTSPDGKTVMQGSDTEMVYDKNTVYLPDKAVPPTKTQVPDNVTLVCLEQKTIDLTKCGSSLATEVGDISLGFKGTSLAAIASLCSEGYTVQWTDNHGRRLSADGMATSADTPVDSCMSARDVASEYHPRFVPPMTTGPWVIIWRLLSPSGKVVVEADYEATVVAP